MKIFVYSLLFLLSGSLIPINAQEVFMPGTPDIPLMEGLRIDVSDDMNFDTPEGQVITFEAQNKQKTGAQIINYYRDILPKLGWIEIETNHFIREKDSMILTIIHQRKPGIIRFEITSTNTHE